MIERFLLFYFFLTALETILTQKYLHVVRIYALEFNGSFKKVANKGSSRAEKCGADTDYSGAFFDSNFKVVRHPHGELKSTFSKYFFAQAA